MTTKDGCTTALETARSLVKDAHRDPSRVVPLVFIRFDDTASAGELACLDTRHGLVSAEGLLSG